MSARRLRVVRSGTQTTGKRSCFSRSRRWWASRRSGLVFRTTIARILAAWPTRSVWPRHGRSAWNYRVEPQRVTGVFDADGDGGRQHGIEAFNGVAELGQLLAPDLARVRVEQRDLLLARVQVASDEITRPRSSRDKLDQAAEKDHPWPRRHNRAVRIAAERATGGRPAAARRRRAHAPAAARGSCQPP
jgi:hypothetical protein